MFAPEDILYEDNHLLIVNKRCGDLVQPDPSGGDALERQIKEFIRRRDAKPGEVFLGVVHRIDRPVSGAVIFAKTSKALARLNEMIRRGEIEKTYWALTESRPDPEEGELSHYILRNEKTNRSRALDAPGAMQNWRNCVTAPWGEYPLYAGGGRFADGAPPSDPGAALEDRLSD